MKLVDLTAKDYIAMLASDAPAPGGGSASAFCGAQGAALFVMVASLTVSKEKYALLAPLCKEVIAEGEALQHKFLELIDRDAEAFLLVSGAFKMPKDTDKQKQQRSHAIAQGMLVSTEVPFETMRCAFKGLEQASRLIGHSNPNAASDLGVAALNLLACVKGAYLNVKINLGGLKNIEKKMYFEENAQILVAEAEKLADNIYNSIETAL